MITLVPKNIIFAIFLIFISLLEFLLIDWKSLSIGNLNFISWIIIINLVLQALCWKAVNKDYISFFFAFVVFYYVFHFGQVVITGLMPNYPLEYLNYVTTYMNDENLGITIEICVFCINSFFIGGLIFKYKINKKHLCEKRCIGSKLFWILFPIKLCLDLVQIAIAMYLGYNGVNLIMRRVPGIISCLANMWYATIPIYYLSLLQKNKNKKAHKLVIWTVVYMCITMLTGNRGHQMVAIISLMIVVLLTQKRHTTADLLKYGLYGLGGLFFIDIIYAFRETSISEFFSNMGTFTKTADESNIFIETIGTFGETIFTPYLVLEKFQSSNHPFFGEAFIKSIVGIIPDATGIFKKINDDAIFTRRLGTKYLIGGSFAAEMYYNFKELYPIFSCMIGMIFSMISERVNKMIRLKYYTEVTFGVAVCGLFIWWVRDSVGNLTRQVVWMYLLIYYFGGFKKVITPIRKKYTSTRDNQHLIQ